MTRILVCGKLSDQGLDLLRREAEFQVDVESELSSEKLAKIISSYEALTVRSDTKVTDEVFASAKKLKVIVRSGIGIDNIDVKAATQRGILVMNTPSGNMITTAEHALSLLMALCRHIPQATESLKSGQWEKKKFTGIEIFDKTMGLIGLGNVGSIVAKRANGLKMKVMAYDPYVSQEVAQKLSVELVSLDKLLASSDFVSIHVPLNDKTKYLIHKGTLKKMKKTALLIQCARGGIVNEKDLYDALKEGTIAGAALDVFEVEPPGKNPLFTCENVICTPHLGASTGEAQHKVGIETAEQLIAYFKEGVIRNAVNMPSLSIDLLKTLGPYLDLCQKMGIFQGQVMGDQRLKSIEIEYFGEVSTLKVEPLTNAILKGFLSQYLEKTVNEVNAMIIAKQRGIDVRVSTSSRTKEFTNLISVSVRANGHHSLISGTIFNESEPRLVQIDRFYLEAIPEGKILLVRNANEPGVIGNIGTVLGKNKINISRFQLGLDEEKNEALSLINVDSSVDADILQELLQLPHVVDVKQLSF